MKKSKSYTKNTRVELKRKILKTIAKRQDPLAFFEPLSDPEIDQKSFLESTKRNLGVFGGNRSGKTLSGAVKTIKYCRQHPGADCWAATWADMSVAIQQKKYYELIPKNSEVVYAKFTEQRGFANRIIIFKNGSTIRFKTYDQGRESFQGAAKDIIHLDEEPPQSIVSECMARLIDKNGALIRTMTPLDGITYTYDEFILNENDDPEIEYWYWDNSKNIFVDQKALERIIGSYAGKEAEVRSKGTFMNLTTGNAYYSFSEDNIISEFDFDGLKTVDGEFRYMHNRPIEVDCDFNIDLMSWGVAQEHQDIDYTFDELELENHANTELLCQMLKSKYAFHKGGWIFYGDIAGNQRHPEASRTNWAIIRDNFPNAEIYYQHIKNIKDRVDSTNARLKDSSGKIHAYITKNCKRKIKDYRQVTWEMLLNKTKAGKLTHASDGSSYKFFWKYPLTLKPTGYQE